MDAPNPALLAELKSKTHVAGIVLHHRGGGSHGITGLANYAELSRRLPLPLLSLNPLYCADSVGANCAALITAPSLTDPSRPRYEPSEYIQIYADNALSLLSPDTNVAVTALRNVIGDYTLRESLASIHISSAEICKSGIDPTYFNSHSERFKTAYPLMDLTEERQPDLETWKAVMASGSFITHRGVYVIDEKKYTDMAWAETHSHLIDYAGNFHRAYPNGTLTKINFGNNYRSDELPDHKVGMRWVMSSAAEQGRLVLRKHMDRIHSKFFDHIIDLSLVIPKGEKIPSAFSSKPSDINALMEWTRHMIMQPDHQVKLDQAAAHIIREYGLEAQMIGEPLIWPSPLPVREHPNPVAQMGGAFFRSAQPVAVSATTHAAKWLASKIRTCWNEAVVPARNDLGYFLMNGTHASDARARQARQAEAATPLSQTRLSEPHMPSGSDHMPL